MHYESGYVILSAQKPCVKKELNTTKSRLKLRCTQKSGIREENWCKKFVACMYICTSQILNNVA